MIKFYFYFLPTGCGGTATNNITGRCDKRRTLIIMMPSGFDGEKLVQKQFDATGEKHE